MSKVEKIDLSNCNILNLDNIPKDFLKFCQCDNISVNYQLRDLMKTRQICFAWKTTTNGRNRHGRWGRYLRRSYEREKFV